MRGSPLAFVPTATTLSHEILAWRTAHRHVAGIDEVGRGPMAGPVVAAAVVLDPQFAQPWWSDLHDSKLLTALQRARLARLLHESAAVGVGEASHDEVDTLGLVAATRQSMLRALEALPCQPDFLLIDALLLPERAGPQQAIVHGDARCASIAAASIIAKVARDRMMDAHHQSYPHYGFDSNKGYCTRNHLAALNQHGPSPIHRRSFAPVRAYLDAQR